MPTISKTVARFEDTAGLRNRRIGQYTGPSSYATGGDPLVPGDVGLGDIEFFDFEVAITAAAATFLLVYDTTNQKVIWVDSTSGLEVAALTDLSGASARFEAVGR